MKILLSVFLILFINISDAQTSKTEDYKILSLKYVSSKLLSPSTAQLVQYDSPKDGMKILNDGGFHIPDCYKVTRVVVDAQNAFGAMIRQFFMVFFVKDEPCHLEPTETFVKLASYDEGQRNTMLEATLEIAGCDCKK